MRRVIRLIALFTILVFASMAYVRALDGNTETYLKVKDEMFAKELYSINNTNGIFIKKDDKGNLLTDAKFVIKNNEKLSITNSSSNDMIKSPGNLNYTISSTNNGEYNYLKYYNSQIRIPFQSERTYINESSIDKKLNNTNHKITLKNYANVGNNSALIFADLLYDNKLIMPEFVVNEFENISDVSNYTYKITNNDIYTIRGVDGGYYFVVVFEIEENIYKICILDDNKALGITSVGGFDITTLEGPNASRFKVDGKYYPFRIEDDMIRILTYYDGTGYDSIEMIEIKVNVKNDELYYATSEIYAVTASSGEPIEPIIYYDNREVDVTSFMTSDQRDIINNMKNVTDFERIYNTFIDSNDYCLGKTEYLNKIRTSKGFIKRNNSNPNQINIGMYSFMLIDEAITPKGLEKSSIVEMITIDLYYLVESNGDLTLLSTSINVVDPLLRYDDTINYNNLYEALSKIDNSYSLPTTCNNSQNYFSYTCDNEPEPTRFIPNSCNFILIDNTSTEDLNEKVEITTYVNGKENVNIKKDSQATVSIKLFNNSKTPLYNIRIVSKLPEGFSLVDESINKGGSFSKEDGIIVWNLDYLDSKDSEIFTFKVKTPVKSGTYETFKLNASVSGERFEDGIISTDALINVGNRAGSIVNPNTGNFVEVTLLFIFIISIGVAIFMFSKNSIQKI